MPATPRFSVVDRGVYHMPYRLEDGSIPLVAVGEDGELVARGSCTPETYVERTRELWSALRERTPQPS